SVRSVEGIFRNDDRVLRNQHWAVRVMERHRELFAVLSICAPAPKGFEQSVMAVTGGTARYSCAEYETRGVIAGLVPAISIRMARCQIIGMAGFVLEACARTTTREALGPRHEYAPNCAGPARCFLKKWIIMII